MKKWKLALLVSVFTLLLGGSNLLAAQAGYDKGFYIKSKDKKFKLKTNIQLMPQYQFLAVEGQGKVNTFQLRKGRIIFSGNAFGSGTTYKFQVEAVGGGISRATEGAGQTGSNLRDAYMNHKFSDTLQVKFGQFKPYHNREELTSSSKLQFVDRSVSNEVFSHGRDLGFALHGELNDQFDYALFATNDGVNRNTINNNNEFLTGFRLVWNAMGDHGYTMSDIKGSEDHQLSIGVASNLNFPATAGGDPTVVSSTADVSYRYKGFSFIGEGHYIRDQTNKLNLLGGLGQVGYFLVPGTFEVAARYAAVIPTAAGVVNGYETGASLNYFVHGHNLKVQIDYNLLWNSALRTNASAAGANNAPTNAVGGASLVPGFVQNQNDSRVRLQTQLYF